MKSYVFWAEDERIEVPVIYSKRKSLGLQIKYDGAVTARVPQGADDRTVQEFLRRHEEWIVQKRKRFRMAEDVTLLPAVVTEAGKRQIRALLEARTAKYASLMGVTYGRISLRSQKTRWGSCSVEGNLNFNSRLLFVPPELVDYVVVHELAHRKHMDHSPAFWQEVERYLPDYRERRSALKKYRFES